MALPRALLALAKIRLTALRRGWLVSGSGAYPMLSESAFRGLSARLLPPSREGGIRTPNPLLPKQVRCLIAPLLDIGLLGFEPRTFRLGGGRSVPLSYKPVCGFSPSAACLSSYGKPSHHLQWRRRESNPRPRVVSPKPYTRVGHCSSFATLRASVHARACAASRLSRP